MSETDVIDGSKREAVRVEVEKKIDLDIEKIEPFQGNLKSLTEESYKKFKAQILELGFSEPISVWHQAGHYFCLNGHQRLRTLKQMKQEGYSIPPIPCNVIRAKSKKEARKKVLALASQYGDIEREGLYELMHDSGLEFKDLSDFKFSDSDMDMDSFEAEFFTDENEGGGGLTDDDQVPESVEERVKYGELWALGENRLLCGDATKIEDVEKLMGGEKADMVFTDPPYGVSYQNKVDSIDNQSKNRKYNEIKSDDLTVDQLKEIIQSSFHNIDKVLAKKSCYYICSPQGGELGLMMMMMMQEANLPCRHMVIWAKNAPVFSMGRLDYDYQHEPILFGWSKNRTHYKSSGKGQWKSSLWELNREINDLHPTMKPIALVENALQNSCPENGIVLDLFCGSGSTIVAAEKVGRRGFGMEIDPHYCSVILKRWENYTGLEAELIKN